MSGPDEVRPEDVGPDELLRVLKEVQSEPEIECAHCGAIPDGVLAVHTDQFSREHRICNNCATELLRWL